MRRGLLWRALGVFVGAVIAAALVVGMQIPLLGGTPTSRVTLATLLPSTKEPTLVWPSDGSAAIDVPSLGVLRSVRNHEEPIASLTKMMTAYVALKLLPLGVGATGPCLAVSDEDVTLYHEMLGLDESSVFVSEGEQLCESDLLNGLLVHSAGNYAVMLADLAAGTTAAFVADMNADALHLGLYSTHYRDVTGISPLSVSTARDQARLATLLMKSPLVRAIVDQDEVTLPLAGSVGSFTPYVGVDNVIGVKSGRTSAAGGCDVMAMTFVDGSATHVAYAVVLDQRGGNLLGPAGDAALALAQSAVDVRDDHTFEAGTTVGTLAFGSRRVAFGFTQRRRVWWFPAQGRPTPRVKLRHLSGSIHRGEPVGTLEIDGVTRHVFVLRALKSLSPPSLWARLR